jgi:hypothetical protein
MMREVTYEDAMEWLDQKLEEAEYGDEEIIEYIKEVLWRDNDMRTS